MYQSDIEKIEEQIRGSYFVNVIDESFDHEFGTERRYSIDVNPSAITIVVKKDDDGHWCWPDRIEIDETVGVKEETDIIKVFATFNWSIPPKFIIKDGEMTATLHYSITTEDEERKLNLVDPCKIVRMHAGRG